MTTNVTLMFQQAYTLHQADQLDQAIKLYTDILHQDSLHLDTLRYIGLAFAQLGDFPKAIDYFHQALMLQPDDAKLHLNIANTFKKIQSLEQLNLAKQTAEKSAVKVTSHLHLDHLLSIHEEKKSFWEEAEKHYLKALKLEPNYAQAHNNLAGLYADQENFNQALKHYRDALHADPSFTPAHSNLGLLFLKHHKLDEAKIQFQNVLALSPENSLALFYLGLLAINNNEFKIAEDYFQRAFAIDPENVDILVNLGVIALKQEKEQLAIDFFTRALVLDEHHIEARHNLAATFIHFDRYENALTYYQDLLQQTPDHIEYLYNTAVAQMGLGHLNEAMPLFERIFTMQPQHFGALSNMAAIEMRLNHREEAIRLLEQALKAKPGDQTSAFMLQALQGSNRRAEACPSYVYDLFNHYALYYDQHMQATLHYAIPQRIWALLNHPSLEKIDFFRNGVDDSEHDHTWTSIQRTTESSLSLRATASIERGLIHRALDLGCGTGLTGLVLRPICEHLTGVDIAPKMLYVAREKKLYDELIEAEILTFLESDTSQYELIVAADVLPYLGDLKKYFECLKPRLNPSHHLVLFTTEICKETPWALQENMRFCHHPDYIHSLCEHHDFYVMHQEKMVARKQDNQDLEVMLYAVHLALSTIE